MEKRDKAVMDIKLEKCTDFINKGPTFGERHVQALLLFFGISTEMMTRLSLSLSIVAMTDDSASANPHIPTYDWEDTNVIISSFYWGYIILQVLAGQLAKNFGTRWLLFFAMLINSLATTVIPLAANFFGSKGVIVCRVLQGLSQGGIIPSCQTMLGRWAPKDERGRMSTFVYTGYNLGTIICLPITGLIAQSSLGWPVSFYLFGGCGLLWSAAWFFFGHSSPASHPYITKEERQYIEVSLNQEIDQVIPTPWKQIFLSVSFWAMVITSVGSGFGVIFLQNEIPTYLEKVMKHDIASSGYLSSMLAAVGVLATYVYGPLSDFLVENRYLSRVNARKLFETYSCFGCAASLLALAFLAGPEGHLPILLLTLSSIFGAGTLFGHGVNSIDLSPRFSGILMSIANSLACAIALFAPLSVQFIVSDETNAVQWRMAFVIAALAYMIPAIFFLFGASGERQWWDDGAEEKNENIVKVIDKIHDIKEKA